VRAWIPGRERDADGYRSRSLIILQEDENPARAF